MKKLFILIYMIFSLGPQAKALTNYESNSIAYCATSNGETLELVKNSFTGNVEGLGNFKRTGQIVFSCNQGSGTYLWHCSYPSFYNYRLHAIILNPDSTGKVLAKVGYIRNGFRLIAEMMTCSKY